MKKSIVALLAASAVIALTGVGAAAVGSDDMRIRVSTKSDTAGTPLTVKIDDAKPGCNVSVKVYDETYEGSEEYTGDKVASTTVKIGANRSGTGSVKVPQAGWYSAYAKTLLTKLACIAAHQNSSADDTDDFEVGKGVYVYNIEGEGDYSAEDEDQNQWNYSLAVQVYGDATVGSDKPRAGVGVELWVENMSNSRMYKLKTATTNSLGEATFKGVWDEDLHYSDYFEVRITRNAKFYDTFDYYDGSSYGVAYGYILGL